MSDEKRIKWKYKTNIKCIYWNSKSMKINIEKNEIFSIEVLLFEGIIEW